MDTINARRQWAMVEGIGRGIFARTQDGEWILTGRSFHEMENVQIGDVISFIPSPIVAKDGVVHRITCKWFGGAPHIIARSVKRSMPVPPLGESTFRNFAEDPETR